jgi:hypothetical protein
MDVTRALAYYHSTTITAVKGFIRSTPGACIIKILRPLFTDFRNNLECLTLASLF